MNFMYFMAPHGWNFLIVSAEEHRKNIHDRFPHAFFKPIEAELLHRDDKNMPQLTIENYNRIFMSSKFWSEIPGEYIAVFQRDCIMYRMFEEYWPLKYDFAGAYFWTLETSQQQGVINGGFSLRNRTAMVNICKNITWDAIEIYRHNNYKEIRYFQDVKLRNEDVFFTFGCEILKYSLPCTDVRKQLAIESEYHLGTSVFHGWTRELYQTVSMAFDILKYSPLFFHLFTPQGNMSYPVHSIIASTLHPKISPTIPSITPPTIPSIPQPTIPSIPQPTIPCITQPTIPSITQPTIPNTDKGYPIFSVPSKCIPEI
jgi:hypothetical protein